MTLLGVIIERQRTNALVGWSLLGLVVLSAIESMITGAYLWAGFVLLTAGVVVLPALRTRDWTAMIPWVLLALVTTAAVTRSFGYYPEAAGYVAVATLALILVIELDTFTPVEMTRRFAVAFAVLATMAVQGLWVIAQFYSDRWLGTGFLRSQTELQWDLVLVTLVGIVLGGVFEVYLDVTGKIRTDDRTSNRTSHDAQ